MTNKHNKSLCKCLKFLKLCWEDEEELSLDIIDSSLWSPNLLFKFRKCLKPLENMASTLFSLPTQACRC